MRKCCNTHGSLRMGAELNTDASAEEGFVILARLGVSACPCRSRLGTVRIRRLPVLLFCSAFQLVPVYVHTELSISHIFFLNSSFHLVLQYEACSSSMFGNDDLKNVSSEFSSTNLYFLQHKENRWSRRAWNSFWGTERKRKKNVQRKKKHSYIHIYMYICIIPYIVLHRQKNTHNTSL